MNFKRKVILLLKKILPSKIINILIIFRDIPKKIKINYSKYILKFLITNIYDQSNVKLFSLRNFGGSTISRGFHLFSSQPEISNWIDSFQQNSCFVDVGANIGLYSLYAAKKKHVVLAFEPESLNFACLNLNIKDNNLQEYISAYPISLNDSNDISYLNLRDMKFGGSGSTFGDCLDESGNKFNPTYKQGSISFKLDDILKKKEITVNYIKIDVDGNELNVLKGMQDLLSSESLKSICIELNPETIRGKEIIDMLKKNFAKYEKKQWYKNQKVFNYIFEK